MGTNSPFGRILKVFILPKATEILANTGFGMILHSYCSSFFLSQIAQITRIFFFQGSSTRDLARGHSRDYAEAGAKKMALMSQDHIFN